MKCGEKSISRISYLLFPPHTDTKFSHISQGIHLNRPTWDFSHITCDSILIRNRPLLCRRPPHLGNKNKTKDNKKLFHFCLRTFYWCYCFIKKKKMRKSLQTAVPRGSPSSVAIKFYIAPILPYFTSSSVLSHTPVYRRSLVPFLSSIHQFLCVRLFYDRRDSFLVLFRSFVVVFLK